MANEQDKHESRRNDGMRLVSLTMIAVLAGMFQVGMWYQGSFGIGHLWLGILLFCAALPIAMVAVRRLSEARPPEYPRGHCQTCGYDLVGDVVGRCPECGTARPPRQPPPAAEHSDSTAETKGDQSITHLKLLIPLAAFWILWLLDLPFLRSKRFRSPTAMVLMLIATLAIVAVVILKARQRPKRDE